MRYVPVVGLLGVVVVVVDPNDNDIFHKVIRRPSGEAACGGERVHAFPPQHFQTKPLSVCLSSTVAFHFGHGRNNPREIVYPIERLWLLACFATHPATIPHAQHADSLWSANFHWQRL